jgi:hypothetical protein
MAAAARRSGSRRASSRLVWITAVLLVLARLVFAAEAD